MAHFFINRPIFAWVIAIVIMLGGGLALQTLPIEQYPDIAPPQVSISATYTGASAETVDSSVSQVISYSRSPYGSSVRREKRWARWAWSALSTLMT